MSYYQALGLKKEPFSISPDPAFFYRSAEHTQALQRLEITIRLKRGLSLVLGDIGTGKTTLGRVLSQQFKNEDKVELYLILNPLFQSEFQFLEHLAKLFQVQGPMRSAMDCLEAIQDRLYRAGVEEGKTMVLLIDEGQNLPANMIEILRALLNFETNEQKLLQLVLLAQMEALPRLQRTRNFMDRVAMKYIINPFDEEETRRMIQHRLQHAGAGPKGPLFTDDAVRRVHYLSQGYPRKINRLCQRVLERLASSDRRVADVGVVNEAAVDAGVEVEES
jgi:general secretion pathway protein A